MRKFLITIVALFISMSAFAQLDNIKWGVKGGLNLTKVTKWDDQKLKPSFYLGGLALFEINDYFAIQPELIYSRQGSKMKYSVDGHSVKAWNRLNYLNIPIIAKLYILEGLSIDVGPQFGFLLNGKTKTKAGGETAKTSTSDAYKTFDVSFAMGATYALFYNINVSAKYNLGLTKVNKEGKTSKNSVIQIGMEYMF